MAPYQPPKKVVQFLLTCDVTHIGISSTFTRTFFVQNFGAKATKLAFGFEIFAPKVLYEKRECIMLMKLTPVVNFINVKRTNFSYEHCVLAAFSSYMYIEKRRSYKKCVRVTLMKLTPVGISRFCHPMLRVHR